MALPEALPKAVQERIKANSRALRDKYGPVVAEVLDNGLVVMYEFFQQMASTYGVGTTIMLFVALAEKEVESAKGDYAEHIKMGKEVGKLYAKMQTDYTEMAKEELARKPKGYE